MNLTLPKFMFKKYQFTLLFAVIINLSVFAQNETRRVLVETPKGNMLIKLYNATPHHRDNFYKLSTEHFFDSLLFHRVIKGFMVQGGDPDSKKAAPGQMLGMGDIGYRVPAEFVDTIFHKKGVLAAARDGNPEMASSGCQFYIVQGRPYGDDELNMMEQQTGKKYSAKAREAYKTLGGTPFLDGSYTVFGEIEWGMEVVDALAAVETLPGDRPKEDVRMKITALDDASYAKFKKEYMKPAKASHAPSKSKGKKK